MVIFHSYVSLPEGTSHYDGNMSFLQVVKCGKMFEMSLDVNLITTG